MGRLTRKITDAVTPVSPAALREASEGQRDHKARLRPHPPTQSEEVEGKPGIRSREVEVIEGDPEAAGRKTADFIKFEVTGSEGKRYKVVCPASYYSIVPKVWSWNASRYKAAELIAEGVPYTQIAMHPEVGITNRMVLYGWMEHPEFREHVEGLTLETGYASRRERIAGMNRLTRSLFDKLERELLGLKLTDKSIGPVINGILAGMKQLSQEKGELIEVQKIEQNTNISGGLDVAATVKVGELLSSEPDERRRELEAAFDQQGNDIIRQLIGE